MRRGTALVLLFAAAARGDDAADVRQAVQGALDRGDRAAALALVDPPGDPGRDPRWNLEAGRAAMELVKGPDGDLVAARRLVQALRAPKRPEGAYELAMALRRRVLLEVEVDAEKELLGGLVELYPETLDFAYDLALAQRDSGRPDEARAVYEKAIAKNPDERKARFSLAQLLQESGATDEALKRYDELIDLGARQGKPDFAAHRSKVLQLLWTLHDLARAREALDAGLAAAAALPPGPERDDNVARFEGYGRDLDEQTARRGNLRRIRGHLHSVLAGVAAAWAIVVVGGILALRRARWI